MTQDVSYMVSSVGQREDLPFAETLARSFYKTYVLFGKHCVPINGQRLRSLCYFVSMRSRQILDVKIGYETNGSRLDTILLNAEKTNAGDWIVEHSVMSSPQSWFQPFTTPFTKEVISGLAPGWDLMWNSLDKRGSLALRIVPVDISTAHNRLALAPQKQDPAPCS